MYSKKFDKENSNKVIVVLGTTASGKTKLAVHLAKKFNGEIISADSRQIYIGMNIGTGKDLGEYGKSVPYHIIDIISPKKQFTVAEYQKLAYAKIEEILKRDNVPIFCGGTGLYIDAVVEGYQLGIRNKELGIRKKLNKKSLTTLLGLLKKIDPKTYKVIDKKNRRRVQRALEIFYQTGVPKSQLIGKKKPPYEFLKIGVTLKKNKLEKRIGQRLKVRLRQGMMHEVQTLHAHGVSWKRLEEFGLEYRWGSRYIRGMISEKILRENLFKEIKKFAKRQMTWFKRDRGIVWIRDEGEANILVRDFLYEHKYASIEKRKVF